MKRRNLRVAVYAALAAITVSTAGCGTILPPVPEFKVVDTKATPDELLAPSIDPIDQGMVTPFKPDTFVPVEISMPKADRLFGLTYTEDKGQWAHTQNTSQLLVNGKRVVDPQGTISVWSAFSDTGFITYLVRNDRVEKTPDELTHYDLKLLDVRSPGKPPQKIATYATGGGRHLWRFGNDPDPLEAELYHLTSKGVVLLREDNTVITYFEAGKAPVTSALPVGYKAASFGVVTDLAYSKHLRIVQHRGPHKLMGLLPSAQEELYDISFWHLERGMITSTAKDVVINVTSEDSFQNYVNGASQMVNAASGPLVITIEDTLKKTIARNLATLEKVTLVETPMKQGHGFKTGLERRRAGGIGIKNKVWVRFGIANGDMSNSQITDLEKWMKDKAATVAQVESH